MYLGSVNQGFRHGLGNYLRNHAGGWLDWEVVRRMWKGAGGEDEISTRLDR